MHIAVQTCVITALRDVPTKLFTFRFCLVFGYRVIYQ